MTESAGKYSSEFLQQKAHTLNLLNTELAHPGVQGLGVWRGQIAAWVSYTVECSAQLWALVPSVCLMGSASRGRWKGPPSTAFSSGASTQLCNQYPPLPLSWE